MLCLKCNEHLSGKSLYCPRCDIHWSRNKWVEITRISPPEHLFMIGLLESCGIPLQIISHNISAFPTIYAGPSTGVSIIVPEPYADIAEKIIAGTSQSEN
ncbi:MAG: hypothetical protein LBK69_03815 [Syntrophomonadaceae bacterium]|nr:hypothetical protein [Syntrophomonadaceae bacterium]